MLVQTRDERCVARSVTCRRDESASPHCRGATWPKNEANCVFPVLMQRVTQGEKSGGKDFSKEKEGCTRGVRRENTLRRMGSLGETTR